ncbi:MAG: hypothetical protein CSB47_01955 [Proteobacteria bacterium]|nr:MAG: hypothetical protein CSB47_01955 [Pseudomonadota bacterium]
MSLIKEGLVISAIAKCDKNELVGYLYNYIEQKNDKGAALFKHVVSYISYVSATHYSLSYPEQEDVQQEIAIKLLCQGRQIGDRFTKRLLYVMIRNQCIDQQRKRSRHLATFTPVGEAVETPADNIHAPTPGFREGNDASLLNSLNCLETIFNHIERQPTGADDVAIYTHYALGLSHKEIGMHMKRSSGAIAKRLSTLRQRLKRLKDEYC